MWSISFVGLPGATPAPAVTLQGVAADRPPASSDNEGWMYLATNTNGGTLYRSDGTAWTQASAGVTAGGGDVYKDGVSGGQYINGGIAAGQTLILYGNTDAASNYGAVLVPAPFLTSNAVFWTGVLSPAQITANQDDYSPSGLRTANVLRLSTDASRTLNSLDASVFANANALIVVANVGSSNLVIADEGTGTATNRFALPSSVTLLPDGVTLAWQDQTTGRWRLLGGWLINMATQATGILPTANGGTGSNSTTYCSLATNVVNTLPVANGGTGAASTTAYAVQCGGTTSTGAHQAVAIGTLGRVMTDKGAGTLPAFEALPVATQAEQETGSSTAVLVSPGRQQYHPSACKFFTYFDGTNATPNSTQVGYNVASIDDNGTGDYDVNFTTAFSAATWSCSYSVKRDSSGTSQNIDIILKSEATANPTTGDVTVRTQNVSQTAVDAVYVAVQGHGDQ